MQKSQLGEAFIPIRAMLDMLDKDLDVARGKVTSNLDQIKKNLELAGTGIISGIGAATGAVVALGAAITKVAIDTAPIQGIQNSFKGLTSGLVGGYDEMIDSLQEGSQHMISNRDLMTSFNKAAQLVGIDFAQQLPDAMKYLGKVSAATGQDMSYMMDSLVVGVGRLSPMILDNLGIQVNLAAATERAAEMYGVEASELSKAQQQAGMMSVVLEKLQANTSSMPDITDNVTTKLAQFKATVQNTKDTIGQAFLPVLGIAMTVFGKLSDKFLPKLESAMEKIEPVVTKIAEVVGDFVTDLANGRTPLVAFTDAVYQLFPPEVANEIVKIVAGIQDFLEGVQELVAPVAEWISKNVELQDVLIAVAVAVGTVVLPMVWSLITALAPVIGVFLLVIAAAALLRMAWENDFLGIATFFTDLWENTLKPAFETLRIWLEENIPIAIQKVSDFWTNTLQPALETVWAFIQNNIIPIFETVVAWLQENVPTAIQKVSDFWTGTLQPALEKVWAFVQDHVLPIFESIAELFEVGFYVAVEAVSILWDQVLYPALEKVQKFIRDKLQPVIETIKEWLGDKLSPVTDTIGKLFEKFGDGLDRVKGLIDIVVDALKKLKEWLEKIKTPPELTPGSPTPFELGLLGISRAMRQLNARDLPSLRANLEFDDAESLIKLNGGSGQSAGGNSIQYNLTAMYKYEDQMTLTERVRMLNALAGA